MTARAPGRAGETSGVVALGNVGAGQVELAVDAQSTVCEGAGGSLDVTVRGLFVPSTEPLPVGTFLTLNLKLGDARAQPILARVRAVDDPGEGTDRVAGMSLEFVEVAGAHAGEHLASCLNEAATALTTEEPRWLSGVRVLVADDDEHYREAAAAAMRDAGFDVVTAASGFEALSKALKEQPSAIISDVSMPGMDGWQLLRMVRARRSLRRTPVVFLTDLTSDEERLRGYQLGVDDYIAKPFTSVELMARVERVIERASASERASEGGMQGDLTKVPITSLLSFVEMERRSGALHLMRDAETATLHLREGSVVRIELATPHDQLAGLARFLYVLDWESGRFELDATCSSGPDVVRVTTSFALLEHARLRDEARIPPE